MTYNTGFKTKLPSYFYDIADPKRWVDNFADTSGEERLVLTFSELQDKAERDKAYIAWLNRHQLKSKRVKFQRIRILNDKYSESGPNDWWPKYHAAIFTVWMQPETLKQGKHHMQFYVLCPEDCEMILRYEHSTHGRSLPQRSALMGERWLSRHPALTLALVVPTKCCHHLRNETSGGELEYRHHL